jgi:bisphosphoglycerate-dependent phosphoglycerate mutase
VVAPGASLLSMIIQDLENLSEEEIVKAKYSAAFLLVYDLERFVKNAS